jgi:hypothetical protein
MKKFFFLSLLMIFSFNVFAQEEALRLIAENPDRAANNMHSYEFNPIEDTPAPKGFKPFYISHYGRHGSRYEQNSTFARTAQQAFAFLDRMGLLTQEGKDLYEMVNTVVDAHKGMEGSLTPRGAREHKTLAARMFQRFPDAFKNKDRYEVDSFSSTNFRCLVSMCNFTNSLKEKFPKGDFTFTSTEKYMSYINPSLSIRRPTDPPAAPRMPSSSSFSSSRSANPVVPPFRAATGTPGYDFTRFLTPLFTDLDQALKVLGNPESFVRAIYTTGSYCQDVDFLGIDIFRKYFTPEELVYFWASGNDNIYRMWAGSVEQGDVIRYAIIPLMKDFIEKADAAIQPGSHRVADLRFGHDTSILPLFALMGVDDTQHRNFPYREAHNNGWYAFFQVPMATNCQMIFYKNKKDEVLTKVLYNEKEITFENIQPVSGPYYKWEDLKAYFQGLCDKAAKPWVSRRVF